MFRRLAEQDPPARENPLESDAPRLAVGGHKTAKARSCTLPRDTEAGYSFGKGSASAGTQGDESGRDGLGVLRPWGSRQPKSPWSPRILRSPLRTMANREAATLAG